MKMISVVHLCKLQMWFYELNSWFEHRANDVNDVGLFHIVIGGR